MKLLLLLLLLPTLAFAQEADTSRWLLAIGAHRGTPDQDRLRHATDDARRFADVMQDLGGVQPGQIAVLEDPTLLQVQKQMDRLTADLTAARERGEQPTVLLYYSGHSDDRGLLPWGQLLAWEELQRRVDALPAQTRIVVLDSCASGAFVRGKGGAHVDGFLGDRRNDVQGDIYLTSASADEAAQESERLGGSFFTHHLVVGMRGAADSDEDGLVTLDEAYDYAYRETVSETEISWAGAQHPNYAMDVRGRGDVVMTDLRQRSGLLVVPERMHGQLSIRTLDGLLVAQVAKRAGQRVTVALEPGRYSLRLRTARGVFRTRVVVGDEPAELRAEEMAAVALEQTTLRGPSPRAYTRTVPISLHFSTYLGTYGFRDDVRTQGFSLNVAGVVHGEMDGVDLGTVSIVGGNHRGVTINPGATVVAGRMEGLQIGAWASAREAYGAQISGISLVEADAEGFFGGLFHWVGGRLWALQFGAVNIVVGNAPEASYGFQFSGLYGRIGGHFNGLQIGAINDTDSIRGVQLGGVNITRRLRGLQIGLINVVTEDGSEGESIGLLNVVRGGYFALELATDALSPLSLRVKTGSRHLYSVFRFGVDFSNPGRDKVRPTVGWGLGGHGRYRRFAFDGDVTLLLDEQDVGVFFDEAPRGLFVEGNLSPAVHVSDGFAVFASVGLGFGVDLRGGLAATHLRQDLFVPLLPVGNGQWGAYFSYGAGVRIGF